MILQRLCKGFGVLKFLQKVQRLAQSSKYVRIIVPGQVGFWVDVLENLLSSSGYQGLYSPVGTQLLSGSGNYLVWSRPVDDVTYNVRAHFSNQINMDKFTGSVIEVVSSNESWLPDLAKELWLVGYITELDSWTVAHELLVECTDVGSITNRVLLSVASSIGLWDFYVIEYGIRHRLYDASETSLLRWAEVSVDCDTSDWGTSKGTSHPISYLQNGRSDLFSKSVASAQMAVLFPVLESLRLDVIQYLSKLSLVDSNLETELIESDYSRLNEECRYIQGHEVKGHVYRLYKSVRCPLAHSKPVIESDIHFLEEMVRRYRTVR